MFCKNCGAQLENNTAFCPHCGGGQNSSFQSLPPTSGIKTSFTCPFCQYQGPPRISRQMSGGGWVLFVVLLLFCFPLCWLPFVMSSLQEENRNCGGCGTRL